MIGRRVLAGVGVIAAERAWSVGPESAETGTLVPRSRAGSHSLPATTEGDEIFAVEP